jgi:hypothetical protein
MAALGGISAGGSIKWHQNGNNENHRKLNNGNNGINGG